MGDVEDRLGKIEGKLDVVVEAICGSPDDRIRGLNFRVKIVERFRKNVNKVLVIMGTAVLGLVVAYLKSLITR